MKDISYIHKISNTQEKKLITNYCLVNFVSLLSAHASTIARKESILLLFSPIFLLSILFILPSMFNNCDCILGNRPYGHKY